MKTLFVLIAFTVMGFTISSQTLAPQIFLQTNDTMLCFTMDQSKVLAKHLVNSLYCDSILKQTQTEVELLNKINALKDTSILVLNDKIDNQVNMIRVQDAMITNLYTQIKLDDKAIKRERWLKRIFAAGMFIASIVAVAPTTH